MESVSNYRKKQTDRQQMARTLPNSPDSKYLTAATFLGRALESLEGGRCSVMLHIPTFHLWPPDTATGRARKDSLTIKIPIWQVGSGSGCDSNGGPSDQSKHSSNLFAQKEPKATFHLDTSWLAMTILFNSVSKRKFFQTIKLSFSWYLGKLKFPTFDGASLIYFSSLDLPSNVLHAGFWWVLGPVFG